MLFLKSEQSSIKLTSCPSLNLWEKCEFSDGIPMEENADTRLPPSTSSAHLRKQSNVSIDICQQTIHQPPAGILRWCWWLSRSPPSALSPRPRPRPRRRWTGEFWQGWTRRVKRLGPAIINCALTPPWTWPLLSLFGPFHCLQSTSERRLSTIHVKDLWSRQGNWCALYPDRILLQGFDLNLSSSLL